MGAQFQVDVNVVTHGAEKVNVLEQQLTKMQNKSVDIKLKIEFMKIVNPVTSLGSKIANIFEAPAHYGMNDSGDYEWRLRHMNENKEQSENSKKEK